MKEEEEEEEEVESNFFNIPPPVSLPPVATPPPLLAYLTSGEKEEEKSAQKRGKEKSLAPLLSRGKRGKGGRRLERVRWGEQKKETKNDVGLYKAKTDERKGREARLTFPPLIAL